MKLKVNEKTAPGYPVYIYGLSGSGYIKMSVISGSHYNEYEGGCFLESFAT
jgi:hypothetical protein